MMRQASGKTGFTLVEVMVVLLIIGIMSALLLPSITAMTESHKQTAARNTIKAALELARSRAIRNQRYAGIRFQYNIEGPLQGRQYMVLIANDTAGGNFERFVAVPDQKPIALPEGIGVIAGNFGNLIAPDGTVLTKDQALMDNDIGKSNENWSRICLKGFTTFSIIFSPAGQLVTKLVEVRPLNYDDQMFNHIKRVEWPPEQDGQLSNGIEVNHALFYSDGYINNSGSPAWDPAFGSGLIVPKVWCYQESSEGSFFIFDMGTLKNEAEVLPTARYTDYISQYKGGNGVQFVMINAYTGDFINEDY